MGTALRRELPVVADDLVDIAMDCHDVDRVRGVAVLPHIMPLGSCDRNDTCDLA